MARRLGEELNTLRILDRISGSEIELYYRMPTTRERAAYTNMMIQRQGRKVVSKAAEARRKYGEKILCGVREGDFEVQRDGKYFPIASDENSTHYAADWKDQVMDHAGDLVEHLGAHVFEASAVTLGPRDDDTDDGDADQD